MRPAAAVAIALFMLAIAVGLFFLARGRSRTIAMAVSVLALTALAWPPLAAAVTWPRVDAGLRAIGVPALRAHTALAVDVTRDVPVPLRDGSALGLDFYRPHVAGTLPLIVTMYGGAWTVGSRADEAQLALLAGERVQPVHVRAVVAYYAPTDLVGGWTNPPRPDPAGTRKILADYLGGPPDATHVALYRAAAPLENAHAGMPAVFAIIGDLAP